MEVISREEVLRLVPGFGGEPCGAMLCRVTAQVNVIEMMRALKGACLKGGEDP